MAEQQENGRAASAYFRASPVHDLHDMGETENHLPMKPLALAPLALLTTTTLAQNLVPNGSFEEYTQCPVFFSDQYATGWTSAWGTTDYYNVCAPDGAQMNVPQNAVGYQVPSEGGGYAGLITYMPPGSAPDPEHSREILKAQLSQPLSPGIAVHLSFKYAVALGGSQAGASPRYTCDGLGMRFTMGEVYDGLGPHPNTAALYVTTTPTDTSDWYVLEGEYVPGEAFTHLIIGNFFADSLLSPLLLDSNAGGFVAVSFVDEVCVSYSSKGCSGENGLGGVSVSGIQTSPNPFNDYLTISLPALGRGQTDLQVLDMQGRVLVQSKISAQQSKVSIDLSELSDGAYILRLSHDTEVESRSILRTSP